ncbi:disease resistance protein RUN1 [Trifolium repens]|nr:disease resistance protein RUN1 [Trifolium repens]
MLNGRVVYQYCITLTLIVEPAWYFTSRNHNINHTRQLWVCLNELFHPRKCNSTFPLTQIRTVEYVQSYFEMIFVEIPIDSSRKRKLWQRFQKHAMIQV